VKGLANFNLQFANLKEDELIFVNTIRRAV
jgi:hypothetical protein